jgi:hypothetical protein
MCRFVDVFVKRIEAMSLLICAATDAMGRA